MHRIDGPGATVDKKFTEGDPTGGVPATVVTAAWMTDVQEELITVLSSAGITPAKGAQDQLLKAIRTIASGVVGQVRNLKMSVTAASATATLTADEVIVETALGGLRYCLPSFSKTINLATTGVGGMDTGAAPASGYVAIYAIYNPTTGASGLLATNAASNQPAVYGGANMPAGFTASGLISVWTTTAASLFVPGFQIERKVSFGQVQVLNTAVQQAALTTIAIANAVPQNAKMCSFLMACTATSSSSITCVIAGSATGAIGQRNMSIAPSTGINLSAADMPIVAPQNINYLATVSAGTMSLQIYVTDFTF